MKVDLSNIPESELIDDIIALIQEKENKKATKEGKTIEIEGISSRKLKFYTKKVLGQADLPGFFKVISQGDHFEVFFWKIPD
ncbi:MAG: hypothetical protein JSU57_05895 [Candidatus Heimdallarchaeota archaeon]|nr:MAG: hypothetical protein JSU57_05895 [Candidatus Heimdallarchaeota archaeon]